MGCVVGRAPILKRATGLGLTSTVRLLLLECNLQNDAFWHSCLILNMHCTESLCRCTKGGTRVSLSTHKPLFTLPCNS